MKWIEIIGYAASLLVAASLVMSNIKRLRWINLGGSLAFALYALLVRAWPVMLVNLFVSAVDAYFLWRMSNQKDFFTLLPIAAEDRLFQKFFTYYQRDIARFFPGIALAAVEGCQGFFVLRNMHPVGIFVYEIDEQGQVQIKVDYVIPEYRDRKNAEFLFRILNEQFSGQGPRAFVIRSSVKAHQDYLKREGFELVPSSPELYRKAII